MATHSSVLAWRIPGMVEPGGLLSMGSQRVGHDLATSLSLSKSPELAYLESKVFYFQPGRTSDSAWGKNIIKGIAVTSFSKTSERRRCLEDPLSEIMGLLENLRAGSLRRLMGGSSF